MPNYKIKFARGATISLHHSGQKQRSTC